MAELDKVKKGFERCLSGKMPFGCGECPYFGDEEYNDAWSCRLSLMRDSFDLLKEQEDLGTELTNAVELIHKKNELIEKLLKERETQKFFVDESGKVTPLPVVVRCKDCYYSEHLDSYSVLDKQLFSCCHVSQIGQDKPKMHTGDWFCAYGQLKE